MTQEKALSEERLAELEKLRDKASLNQYFAAAFQTACSLAGTALIAEVRDLRRLAELVSKRHHDHDERGVCFWCGKPWPCVDYADVLALSPQSSREQPPAGPSSTSNQSQEGRE